jgi:acetylornithine deacetylase/succinyl-diaminopimelate desuccinylase-like protein
MNPLESYLRRHQTRFVEELCEYLRLPSVSADPRYRKGMVSCARWLVDHCRKIGLAAELCRTRGNPVVLARTPRRQDIHNLPHYLVYGHYDVQPPDPLELWKFPPFQPRVVGRSLFARGASDNKGQHFAHLKAIEAHLKTSTELPCDLTFVIEGEEEIGSPSLAEFLHKHRARLGCEAVVISDTTLYSLRHPTVTYGLRGLCALEITIRGPSRDLHSGSFGGSVDNPAMALCQLLAQLRDKQGRVTIPGFYDDVTPLSPFERAHFELHPFDADDYKRSLGVRRLFGESGFTPLEQRSARPTLEVNGLTSGYQGAGTKTIIPATAAAKLTMRLVPHQDPKKILALTIQHLRKLCPPTVRMEISSNHASEPYLISPEGELVQAGLEALRAAFGQEPLLVREGGSIPIVNEFKRVLKADSLLLGLALPDDGAHSPNEKFNLDVFAKGMVMSANLWRQLAHGKTLRQDGRAARSVVGRRARQRTPTSAGNDLMAQDVQWALARLSGNGKMGKRSAVSP